MIFYKNRSEATPKFLFLSASRRINFAFFYYSFVTLNTSSIEVNP